MERRHAASRRRARLALIGACGFAAVVLLTSLPLRTWLRQRSDLASTARTVAHLAQIDKNLANEAKTLSSPSAIANMAHREFDYVEPGQKAFDVVPAGSASGGVSVGHVNLQAPVSVPGSGGAAGVATSVSGGTGAARTGSTSTTDRTGGTGGGFWSRVTRTLEFWS